MKKLFITIAFLAAGFFASAQGLFVGGSIGIGTESGKYKMSGNGMTVEQDMPKSFSFGFAPTVGYMFNDNMGVGLDLAIDFDKLTEKDYSDEFVVETVTKTTTFGFCPYFRYVFAEIDNFKFYGDVYFYYMTGTPKKTIKQENVTMTVDGFKTTQLGFGIEPCIAYQLTDNISMHCALNILELGYSSLKYSQTSEGVEVSEKYNQFGFGVNKSTPVTIGFFYNF